MKKNILVTYFSASQVTAGVAKEIARAADADLWEIRPETPYTSADLNWMDRKSRSSLEMTDPDARPAIAGPLPELAPYQVVLIGFPIWWYVEPRIIDTFLESCDLTGKTVIPFATSGGSGIGKAEVSLRMHSPSANWKPGRLLTRREAAAWVQAHVIT